MTCNYEICVLTLLLEGASGSISQTLVRAGDGEQFVDPGEHLGCLPGQVLTSVGRNLAGDIGETPLQLAALGFRPRSSGSGAMWIYQIVLKWLCLSDQYQLVF